MLRIGLTGGIASGKSTVADMMVARGAILIDTDLLAHQVMLPDGPAYHPVVNAFGTDIVSSNGQIDRVKLGAKIFHDETSRQQLNELVHPHVKSAIVEQEAFYRHQENSQDEQYLLVVAIPLLYEVNMAHFVDLTVVVYCPEQMQLERLIARNGLSEEQAWARIRSQLSIEIKAEKADEVIDNSRDLEWTREQVKLLLGRFTWDSYNASANP